MNRPMIAAVVMAVLLAIYLAFTANYALILIRDPLPLVNAMGYALLVLPVLGAWGLFVEMRFAIRSQRLTVALEKEGRLPSEEFPTTLGGRFDRSAAMEAFPRFAKEVEEAPESWQAWLRLGIAYDACGDRRRARRAVRTAIGLYSRN